MPPLKPPSAPPPSTSPNPSTMATPLSPCQQLYHDARASDDVTKLTFAATAKDAPNPGVSWNVLHLHPQPYSGAAAAPGKAYDGESLHFVYWPADTAPPSLATVILE